MSAAQLVLNASVDRVLLERDLDALTDIVLHRGCLHRRLHRLQALMREVRTDIFRLSSFRESSWSMPPVHTDADGPTRICAVGASLAPKCAYLD